MAYPVITGAILIEATGAALNNAGADRETDLDNATAVKQLRMGRNRFPYVSGQAWRRWWRNVLYEDFKWQPSPVTRDAKSAYTMGDPVKYEDDDLFGYMAAKKATKGDSDSGTFRRVSPVKNSLLISVLPNVITSGHWESFSRNLPVDQADAVPYTHQHYTTLLQGTFTISLTDVGRFERGPMRDLPKGGNLPSSVTVTPGVTEKSPEVVTISLEERSRRTKEALQALSALRGGANLTRNNTDVVPVVVLLGYLNGGNAPFQNLFIPNEMGDHVELNLNRLKSVLRDYKERLLSLKSEDKSLKSLYFGYRPGVLANETEVLTALNITKNKEGQLEGIAIFVGDPGEAILKASNGVAVAMQEGH